MRRMGIPLAAILAVACGLAQAQAYRWVDKDGKVRYSDVPPPGAKAKELKAPPAPPAPPAAAADPAAKDKAAKKGPLTPAEQEQAYRERQTKAREAEEKAQKERAAADIRKQNCSSAQESLRSLESGRRVTTINAQGETVVLDDAAIQSRLAQARQTVAENCK